MQEGQEKGLHVQLQQARQEVSQLQADLAASHALSASAERLRQRCMAADEAAAAARAAINQKVGAAALEHRQACWLVMCLPYFLFGQQEGSVAVH